MMIDGFNYLFSNLGSFAEGILFTISFSVFHVVSSYPLLYVFLLVPVACLAVSLIKRLIN